MYYHFVKVVHDTASLKICAEASYGLTKCVLLPQSPVKVGLINQDKLMADTVLPS
jgi:hypothetical protein